MKKIITIIYIFFSFNTFANEDFIPFLQSFYDDAKSSKTLDSKLLKRLNSVVIRVSEIDEIPDYYIGICDVEKNTILVNMNNYSNLNNLKKQQFFDHELGHCVLLRSHYNISNMTSRGEIPQDIMHHTIFGYESLEQMKQMRKELFNPQFYGTQREVQNAYKNTNNNELMVNSNSLLSLTPNSNELRMLEHKVMQERIEKYNKNR